MKKVKCKHNWCFDTKVYEKKTWLPWVIVVMFCNKYDREGKRFVCSKCGEEKIVWRK